MPNLIQVIQILFFLVTPWLVIKLNQSLKKFDFLSPILLCYLIGMLIGNTNMVPFDRDLAMTFCEITVPIAIPLILFSVDFRRWLHLAKSTVISFLLLIASVIASAISAAWLFSNTVAEYWKLSGMLVGVYVGGTANLMAVGMGLRVREETLILANTSDAIIGGIYFLFLITIAKPVIGKFLPPFRSEHPQPDEAAVQAGPTGGWSRSKIIISLILAILLAGVSIGLSLLITRKIEAIMVMLLVTTFGIAASFWKRIRNIGGTYETGQYVILIFSLAIGASVDFGKVLTSNPNIFIYTVYVMTVSIVIHLLLAAWFKIDTDTAIITNTAGIFGPPFIGPVAQAINNRELLVSGIITGLVGLAIGNYVGFGVAWLVMPK
jgi:uncharacterized membrane protein